MMHSIVITCVEITLLAFGLQASAMSIEGESFIFGAWARNAGECARPEITFARNQARIGIDVEGQLVDFYYPNIAYRSTADNVVVKLKKRHPYGKIATPDTLHFRRIDRDTIALRRSRGKDTHFSRCAGLRPG